MYDCTTCSSQFHHKYNCDRHKLTCNFLYNSKAENQGECHDHSQNNLSSQDMYLLMQDMMRRIGKLENENRVYKEAYKRKINVLELLNTELQLSKMEFTFTEWLSKILIPDVSNKLQLVFETTLADGLIALFETAISNTDIEKLPIRTFDKKNGFYIYNKSRDKDNQLGIPQWSQINTDILYSHLRRISYRFEVAYKHWYDKNILLIDNSDELIEKSAIYYLKINDVRVSDQRRFNPVRQKLQTLLLTDTGIIM